MAVVRQAESARVAKNAIVLDLGDLKRQGETIRALAAQEASAIIEKARAERARLAAGGREEGFVAGQLEGREAGFAKGKAEGHAAALAQSRDNLAKLDASWTQALSDFVTVREAMLSEARADVIRLALAIAERVVKRVIAADPNIVASQLAAALDLVSRSTRLTIAVHPDDEAAAREALPAITAKLGEGMHAQIMSDTSLTRGSVIVRTATGGSVDAGIDVQLDRIARTLLPSEEQA